MKSVVAFLILISALGCSSFDSKQPAGTGNENLRSSNSGQIPLESSEAINYFLSEPVSLMDWGLSKIVKSLENIKIEGIENVIIYAEYNAEKNLIEISGLAFPKDLDGLKDNIAKKKRLCVEIMNKMRKNLLVDIKTGTPLFTSCLSGYFGHKYSKVPYEYYKELDKICHLSITLSVGNKDFLTYEGKLLGNEFNFNE